MFFFSLIYLKLKKRINFNFTVITIVVVRSKKEHGKALCYNRISFEQMTIFLTIFPLKYFTTFYLQVTVVRYWSFFCLEPDRDLDCSIKKLKLNNSRGFIYFWGSHCENVWCGQRWESSWQYNRWSLLANTRDDPPNISIQTLILLSR